MTISELQLKIDLTFGERDRSRGLEKSFLWFVEEVGELAEAIRHGDKDAINHETGDVLAWLLSVANVAGLDVEESVGRFARGCPYCGKCPCVCKSE
ncbi:MAG: nucleotide pyrophosphohydrolase [Planctomycetes bacterium]|nr:nucleotide pyrophosphohydrolase [Planctomycetota bacterium]